MSAAKRLGTLGCVGLLATTAACGSTASTGAKAGPSAKITMGTVSAYSSLDPAGAYDYGSWLLFYNVYQGLMTYQPGANVPSPDAAHKCDFTDSSYLTYHCTLNPGLKFSNGDPLDAAAVKFSFDRVIKIGTEKGADGKPADNGSGVSVLLNTMKSVEISGTQDITFHLSTADATFPDRLASGVGQIVDPKTYSGTQLMNGTDVVGSGIYKVDSVQTKPDAKGNPVPVSVKMSLNPNYQGAASKPQNASMTLNYYDTPAQVKTALVNGDIDLNASNDLAPGDVVAMQGTQQLGKGLQVIEGAGTNTRMMVLNTKVAPFNNIAVRQAVARLIDRNAIARDAYNHTVTPLYSVIPQGIGDQTTAFWTAYGEEPEHPDAVKKTLPGVHLPISFTMTYTANASAGKAEAEQIKKALEVGGIFKVTLASVPTLHELGQLWSGGQVPASTTGWQPDYPDPDDYISPFMGDPGVFGSHYASPKIMNQLVPQSLKEVNRADQATADTYLEIQKQIAIDAPFIPLWQNKQYVVTQANVTGVPLTLDAAAIMRFWMIGKS
ncbi:peptide/nickel transport system substrate-binding protein [Streptacidiphilus sp. MAP12-16]|uniref:ABC transporter substrate-binding protein n=1 Tax=Streptacidiphilus sp. MAP12-16 TaxID=3156300 RepID=UPI003513BC36